MINQFIEKFDLLNEDVNILLSTYEKIKGNPVYKKVIKMIEDGEKFKEIEKEIVLISENKYTLFVVVLVSALDIMKKRYDENGISEEIFWDTVEDLTYKIKECKQMYNTFGIEPFTWYEGFFTLRTFKLGRLEFCRVHYYTEGEYVIAVHIPSCGPLKYEDVLDAYKRAYNFFDKTHDSLMAFSCSSWLINPNYMNEIFKEGSNIYKFANDYKIFCIKEDENFHDSWRIFNMHYDSKNLDDLPTETSLQRAFVKYLKDGKKTGSGVGAFMFDGKNILKCEADVIEYLFVK